MKARITLLTLGVDDLERAVAFFRLEAGLKLALWPRESIAADTGLGNDGSRSPLEFTLEHNVDSPAEVDALMASAARAGANVVKKAEKTFYGGYAGVFQDPDGHVWEIAFNPGFEDLG